MLIILLRLYLKLFIKQVYQDSLKIALNEPGFNRKLYLIFNTDL